MDPGLLHATLCKETLRQKLRALSDVVKPDDKVLRKELVVEYEPLKVTPYNQEVIKYFDRWQELYYRCLDRNNNTVLTLGEIEPCRMMVLVMTPMFPMRADSRESMLDIDDKATLLKEIEH